MNKIPDNEKKKDLIDLVREGHKIEIYEAKPLLNEGDALTDWVESSLYESGEKFYVRCVLGSVVKNRFLLWVSNESCPFCNTSLHYKRKETKKVRTGRDGKAYEINGFEESKYIGYICPLCEYERSYSAYYD